MSNRLPDAASLQRLFPQLRLLVMHGSRARGDAHAGSDWDFAYLAGEGFDELGLRAALTRTLGTDAVDVVDLERAGAVLRYADLAIKPKPPGRGRALQSPPPVGLR
jgi:predicted nucleotidyltransferase